jgi:hypothetical protein
MVCEIGHEKSSRGYHLTKKGRPNNMGLINKLFFDYIKNYKYKGLVPESYVYLYFSLEGNADLTAANNLITTIISLYPKGHTLKNFDLFHEEILCGKILVIDHINNIEDVRKLYKDNEYIHNYVNPVERGWNKHKILVGEENPW